MARHFLTIEDDQLVDYVGSSDMPTVIETVEQLAAIFKESDYRVLCSSSVDFPEEHTSNPAVLALVAVLAMGDL